MIDEFARAIEGLTPEQVRGASAPAIKESMVQEINRQGCPNVSCHCADAARLHVVDVDADVFNTSNGPLFRAAVELPIARFVDERSSNHCFHLELANP